MLVGGLLQAQEKLPQGRWEVKQVTVEKNTDGKIDTTVYNTAAEVESHILCVQEWKITANNILLRYPNGIEETVDNTLKDNILTVYAFDGIEYLYKCSVNGENLILTITLNYRNRDLEAVVEKRTIILNQQK